MCIPEPFTSAPGLAVPMFLSYLARVNIVARWTQLDAVRGREMFERLMAELDGKGLIENKQ